MKHLIFLVLLSAMVVNKAFSQVAIPNYPLIEGPFDPSEITNDSIKIYSHYEQLDKQPQFPGGINAFYKYVKKNIRYPAVEKENKITGKVFVSFVIEKNGTLTDIKAVRKLDPAYDAEAIRIMKEGPRWEPGFAKRKPVRVAYTVPIDFSTTQ